MDGEFWLGLDKIHRLTNQTVNELRVDLEDFNQANAFASYDLFKVENESNSYELKLGVYSGEYSEYKSLKMTLVVYHLPRKSGNFGWNVNGKMNFVSPNGNFLGKTGFLERYSQTEFPNGKDVLTICHSKPVPGHTPFFICVTWDASTWLLLRVLFCSVQELRRWFWSFERAIWTQRLCKISLHESCSGWY